jgi:hypothetical protein
MYHKGQKEKPLVHAVQTLVDENSSVLGWKTKSGSANDNSVVKWFLDHYDYSDYEYKKTCRNMLLMAWFGRHDEFRT